MPYRTQVHVEVLCGKPTTNMGETKQDARCRQAAHVNPITET